MKSLQLIGSSLLALFLFHQGVRLYTGSQVYPQSLSAFIYSNPTYIFSPGTLDSESYAEGISDIDDACLDVCRLELPLYLTSDDKLFVYQDEQSLYSHLNNQDRLSSKELSGRTFPVISLKDFLTKYPQAYILFQLNANRPEVLTDYINSIETTPNHDQYILCSQFGNIVRHLRDKKPLWNTCASNDEEAKAHILSSIYWQGLATFPTAYFDISAIDKTRYSENFLSEILRRKVFLISEDLNLPGASAYKVYDVLEYLRLSE